MFWKKTKTGKLKCEITNSKTVIRVRESKNIMIKMVKQESFQVLKVKTNSKRENKTLISCSKENLNLRK
jgi:hypothetical protein